MATELRLPQLGDVMTEGRLVAWLIDEGADVRPGQPLYELETDKVSFTVEAPSAGTLHRVVAEGETIPVGTVVGVLGSKGSSPLAGEVAAPAAGGGVTASAVPAAPSGSSSHLPRQAGEVLATPAARRAAREFGIDLAPYAGRGRLREADVRALRPTPARSAPVTAGSLPYAGRRRAIGERMLHSRQQTAALTLTSEVRVDAALALVEECSRAWAADGVVLTLTRLVVRACALALRDHPLLNARLDGDQIVLSESVDVGLAMDQEAGLVVPVLRGVERLSLRETARALRELTDRAGAGRLTQAEAAGATFTVTSLASTVVDAFTPILDPPQAAILGLGRVREIAGFEDDRVVRQHVTTLSLTFDHRVLDGRPAARFLGRLAEILARPSVLLDGGRP